MLTLSMSTSILNVTARHVPFAVVPPCAARTRGGHGAWQVIIQVGEAGMDDQQQRPASQHEDYEAQFHAMPPAASSSYWQLIEHPAPGAELPLEVLAHCLRERFVASQSADAARIFETMLKRIESHVSAWAHAVARGPLAHLFSDLKQACYLQLWRELIRPDASYITENFGIVLHRIEQKTAQAQLQQEGARQRPGVEHGTRIPRSQMESIEAGRPGPDGSTLPLDFADPAADAAFAEADFSDQLQDVLRHLTPEERDLLYRAHVQQWTQKEMAEHFHTTDRTIRNRLNRLWAKLRRYYGGEEGHHGK